MGTDKDGSTPEEDLDMDLDLDEWDPDDTFLAEKPEMTMEDIRAKKQIPRREQLTAAADKQKAQRWEHQLEEGATPPTIRPVARNQEQPRPEPFEMLAGDFEDVIPEGAHESGDDHDANAEEDESLDVVEVLVHVDR